MAIARKLQLTLVQQAVGPEIAANLARGEVACAAAAAAGSRLVVFPELSFTPFYPQRPVAGVPLSLAEPLPGPTSERFGQLARRFGIAVLINLYERRGRRAYDTAVVIAADGAIAGTVRMAHIMEGPGFHERGYYAPGEPTRLVVDLPGLRLGVATCYDRHFPEYMRELALQGAELVLVPQAGACGEWPPGLFEAELQVAAFQNGYFAALCNRVGVDGQLTFAGGSFVVSPRGQTLARAASDGDESLTTVIDLDEVADCPARRHFLVDRQPGLYRRWQRNRPAAVSAQPRGPRSTRAGSMKIARTSSSTPSTAMPSKRKGSSSSQTKG